MAGVGGATWVGVGDGVCRLRWGCRRVVSIQQRACKRRWTWLALAAGSSRGKRTLYHPLGTPGDLAPQCLSPPPWLMVNEEQLTN